MADRLARPQPVAVYFATQAACEGFRAAHTSYTKHDEVCQPVRGRIISWGATMTIRRCPAVPDVWREAAAGGHVE